MDLYSAMSLLLHTGRSDMDHTVILANYTMPAFTTQPRTREHHLLAGLILPSRGG